MPLVRKQRPETTICIAGVNPPKHIKAKATTTNLIIEKVDDMRDMYLQSKVFIAPMQIGTGLQNKLLEAMACSIPSISSSLANKALKASDKEEILIADKAQDYANCILELLNNKEMSEKLAKNGREYILNNFRWEKCNEILEESFLNLRSK
jgi:glycosyltransferase involved in cell wall biosynthesis